MTVRHVVLGLVNLSALFILTLAGCQQDKAVSFAQEVQPTLNKYCIECHQPGGAGFEASGFSMETYQTLMRGTNNGPMVIAGDSLGSNLMVLMEGRADPSISMPHGQKKGVPQEQIETIRLWIDQGAQNN